MTKPKRRELDLVVLSNMHLGTYGCQAQGLNIEQKNKLLFHALMEEFNLNNF